MLLLIVCERFAERRESLLFGYVWFAEQKVLLFIYDETPTEHRALLLIRCESLADCKVRRTIAIDSATFLPIRASQPEKLVFPTIILLFF